MEKNKTVPEIKYCWGYQLRIYIYIYINKRNSSRNIIDKWLDCSLCTFLCVYTYTWTKLEHYEDLGNEKACLLNFVLIIKYQESHTISFGKIRLAKLLGKHIHLAHISLLLQNSPDIWKFFFFCLRKKSFQIVKIFIFTLKVCLKLQNLWSSRNTCYLAYSH